MLEEAELERLRESDAVRVIDGNGLNLRDLADSLLAIRQI